MNARQHSGGQSGFTLIELLVVILIIGILAAIAIPSFLNQKGKANDAEAKGAVRSAQTAQEAYFTDAREYADQAAGAGASGALNALEATLVPASTICNADRSNAPCGLEAAGDETTFRVTVTSRTGVTFSIEQTSAGLVERACLVTPGRDPGGCRVTTAATGAGVW